MHSKVKKFFVDKINKAGTFDEAISIAEFFSKLVNASFLRSYDDDEIEKLIFNKFVNEDEFLDCISGDLDKKIILHVVTETFLTGGHTRLMERLASMHEIKPTLLITRESYCSEIEYFSEIFEVKSKGAVEKFKFILNIMSVYEKVVLHIHPDDILTALAVRFLKKRKNNIIYFVNHADHQFSYARGISDIVFEISTFGFFMKNRIGKGVYKSSFLGIPLPCDFSGINAKDFLPLGYDVVSAGSAWKFKPIKGSSFQEIIKEIFRKNKMIKIHVLGVNPLFNIWWWPLKIIFYKRLVLIKSLEYNEYIKFIKNKNIYLDSYPITGGTAFAEAFAKGCLPIGFMPVLMGYTPLDNIRVSNTDEFLKIIENPNSYIEELNSLRVDLVERHSMDEVKRRYTSALDGVVIEAPSFQYSNSLLNYPVFLDRSYLFGLNFDFDGKYIFSGWFNKFLLEFFVFINPINYLKIFKKLFISRRARKPLGK